MPSRQTAESFSLQKILFSPRKSIQTRVPSTCLPFFPCPSFFPWTLLLLSSTSERIVFFWMHRMGPFSILAAPLRVFFFFSSSPLNFSQKQNPGARRKKKVYFQSQDALFPFPSSPQNSLLCLFSRLPPPRSFFFPQSYGKTVMTRRSMKKCSQSAAVALRRWRPPPPYLLMFNFSIFLSRNLPPSPTFPFFTDPCATYQFHSSRRLNAGTPSPNELIFWWGVLLRKSPGFSKSETFFPLICARPVLYHSFTSVEVTFPFPDFSTVTFFPTAPPVPKTFPSDAFPFCFLTSKQNPISSTFEETDLFYSVPRFFLRFFLPFFLFPFFKYSDVVKV